MESTTLDSDKIQVEPHQENIDEVRKLVSEEGREARNLLIWNVPIEGCDEVRNKKPPTSPRLLALKHNTIDCSRRGSKRSPVGRSRIRSASAGRDPKLDFKARYWAFLFENLRRAVDEIYETCQTDENIFECKEVIMVLENYTKDFHSLIEWFNLKREFDRASPNRPNSLTWEIRRPTSRSHLHTSTYHLNKLMPRSLFKFDFDSSVSSPNDVSNSDLTLESLLIAQDYSSDFEKNDGTINENGNSFNLLAIDRSAMDANAKAVTTSPRTQQFLNGEENTKDFPESSNVPPAINSSNGFDVIHESCFETNLELLAEELDKLEDDTEGWETVRVRSKYKTSSPNKASKNSRVGGRSNSISGFDMYSDKSSASETHLSKNKKNSNKDLKTQTRPMSGSKTFSSLSNAVENKRRPASAKSLPSLHIKLPEDYENDNKERKSVENTSKSLSKPANVTSKNNQKTVAVNSTKNVKAMNNLKPRLMSDVIKSTANSVLKSKPNGKINKPNHEQTPGASNLNSSSSEGDLTRSNDKCSSEAYGCMSPLLVECMEMMESEPRPPGRVLQIHEKLSSPSRKRSIVDSLRRHEEKQAKAQEQREKILEEKALKWKEISKKLEENRQRKEEVTQQKRLDMERKLQKAEEKRRIQLQMIVRKAHDEEEKVNEIAFINTLEAQNKRIDVMTKIQGHEARLQDIQEERQRRQEEKAAKEAAAEERRRALDAEWQAKLIIMQEKRKIKQHKIEKHIQEKEKERREKARDRDERISGIMAAQQATVEELQKKIQLKQEESARRHEENIEHIRQKALVTSILRISQSDDAPRLVPYDTKRMCSLCNVLIGSEVYLLSHLRGRKHQEALKDLHNGENPSIEEVDTYNLKHIVDAPADNIDPQIAIDKERHKAYRRRSKKLRQRMTIKGSEYENSSVCKLESVETEHRLKLQKLIREINRCFQQYTSGQWSTNLSTSLDRTISEILRLIDKTKIKFEILKKEQLAFRYFGGITATSQILKTIINEPKSLTGTNFSSKTLVNACRLLNVISFLNEENCIYLLHSNRITGLLDLLIHRLNILIPENGSLLNTLPPFDAVIKALLQLLSTIISCLVEKLRKEETYSEAVNLWAQDIISYAVSVGIIDKLSQYFNNVRGSVDNEPQVADFLQQGMFFLMALTKLLSQRHGKVFEKNRLISEDVTQLVATFKITDLVGIVSLLYGMLLHGTLSKGDTPPPEMSQGSLDVTYSALHMLNHFAVLDINTFQTVVGSEGISLEFRHIISYLLWYCSHCSNDRLLHEIILIIGYFVMLNQDNQMMIQSGHMPTVLQQLCLLPFQYFSDPSLIMVLFPTLIASCFANAENSAILEQEVSCELLAHFIEDKSLNYTSSDVPINSAEKVNRGSGSSSNWSDWRWSLECRFPRCKWDSALQYFNPAK